MLPKVVRLHAAATALVCAALTGCTGSSDELDVDGFASGPCTEIAPTLQDVDEVLREVGAEEASPREAADRFKAAQATLKAQTESGPPPVRQGATDLVTSLGFFRIAVDSNNYDGTQIGPVRSDLEALAGTCRGG